MSDSYKKHKIYKDGSGKNSKFLRKQLRRSIKNFLRSDRFIDDLENYSIPNPRTIVNDWDFCEYKVIDVEGKYARK